VSSDIATLGIKVDSTQVVAGTIALVKFQASAQAAANASNAMAAAAKPAAASAAAIQNSANQAGQALQNVTKNTGLARHEMINLSRQIQDVGVSLASGQSPFMVLAQQGTQIADIFGSSKTGTVGGALRQIGSGIASVLTPVRLLAAGFATLAIGTVMVIKNLADTGKQFDDVARAAQTTSGIIHSFQQAAAFKGIDKGDFLKGMQEFGKSIYEAQNNMGGLAEVMRANGRSAKDFTGYMENAAELIKNATSDQQRLQLLQQMGLPATMDWVRFLSQGKDGIRAAIAEAVKFNETAEGKLVESARKFDEAWAKAWNNFGNNAKSAALTAIDALSNISSAADRLAKNVGNSSFWNRFIPAGSKPEDFGLESVSPGERRVGGAFSALSDNAYSNPALARGLDNAANGFRPGGGSKDKNVLLHEIQMAQPPLGVFGQTPTAKQIAQQTPEKESDNDRDRDRRAA
jgi:hypothetical protein